MEFACECGRQSEYVIPRTGIQLNMTFSKTRDSTGDLFALNVLNQVARDHSTGKAANWRPALWATVTSLSEQ